MTKLIQDWTALAAPIANRPQGWIAADINGRGSTAYEKPLGDVIADAQWEGLAPADKGGAQLALMNPGGIRSDLVHKASGSEGDGVVTYGESFTVQPFTNMMNVVDLTGANLIAALKQQVSGANLNSIKILQVSKGFTYTLDTTKTGADRVVDGSVKLNGEAIDPAKTYRVAMNEFLAGGGDSFPALATGTNKLVGPRTWTSSTPTWRPTPRRRPRWPSRPRTASPSSSNRLDEGRRTVSAGRRPSFSSLRTLAGFEVNLSWCGAMNRRRFLVGALAAGAGVMLGAPAASAVDVRAWMAAHGDGTELTRLTIPGTHDSGARFGGPWSECQNTTVAQQLDSGIRFLDVRCRVTGGSFAIHHGASYQNAMFGDVLVACRDFLAAHPSETVLMRVKQEYSEESDATFRAVFDDYLDRRGWRPSSTSATGCRSSARPAGRSSSSPTTADCPA